MILKAPNISTLECVAFSKGKFDSHAAFDPKKESYTFTVTGNYYFSFDKKTYFKAYFIAGSRIENVEYVQKANCFQEKNALKCLMAE